MPSSDELKGQAPQVIAAWLKQVQEIRAEQSKLFTYLLDSHPMDFTFFSQSCEDRVGHWLYPIEPFNVGYDPAVNGIERNAFPDQYRALDKVIGILLEHLSKNTTIILLSDHGIKPVRYPEDPHMLMDHGGTTPVIAKHDYSDGDEVPGIFVAMGPNIKQGLHLEGLEISAYDIAPTILSLYGIAPNSGMKGRALSEIFNDSKPTQAR